MNSLFWVAHISLSHDPFTIGAQVMIFSAAVAVILALTIFKRWKWLWREWLTAVDPKKIGIMYSIVALIMLLRGFADAGMMRAQQALVNTDVGSILNADQFQQVFTAHGTIMIFFAAMGLMFGLINLIVPLQIGARDVAFPFLNATSFWFFTAGAMLINISLVVGEQFAATGWLAYPPLSGIEFSPGVGVDYWVWALQIAGIGSLLAGINFIVTIIKMRAPGMSLMKMPIFSWSVLGSMTLVIFAFPILTATLSMLALDRILGMHFFTADFGGNPMMYVNLIWAWGHPEVYILILPAFGIFSEVVATFSRKRLFGYTSMVIAIWAIVILSFIVWLHHFFTMGAGADVNAFFGIMTMAIAIPTGVKVFNWLFTMYRGRIRFSVPMIWFMGFVIIFITGGMTGVLLAVPAADFQLHNSLFLVAHFHSMVVGGVLFGFLAGLIYWFPKIFSFKLNEKLGKYSAYCWIVGFLVAFMPLYILGLMGATRRLDSYDPNLGWGWLFGVAAVGVAIIGLGVALLALQLIYSVWKRNENRDLTGDPWDGRTLEWATSSPAPIYNFAVQPDGSQRDAWWAAKKSGVKLPEKFHAIHMPKNTPIPFILGIVGFIGCFAIIWEVWWLAGVSVVGAIALLIVRSLDDETEYTIPAAKIRKLETERHYK